MNKSQSNYSFLGAILGFICFNVLAFISLVTPFGLFFPPIKLDGIFNARSFDDHTAMENVKFIAPLVFWPTLSIIFFFVGFYVRKNRRGIAFAVMSFSFFGFFFSSFLSLFWLSTGSWVPPY